MTLKWLPVFRLCVLCAVLISAIAVAAFSAIYISTTMNTTAYIIGFQVLPLSSVSPFAALNLVASAITLISLLIMIVINCFRRGAFTSIILVEICWLSFLWVLWLAAASYNVASIESLTALCAANRGTQSLQQACWTSGTAAALGFLSSLMLLAYAATLITVGFISQKRGVHIWKYSVRDTQSTDISIKRGSFDSSGGYYSPVPPLVQDQTYPVGGFKIPPSAMNEGYGNGVQDSTPAYQVTQYPVIYPLV